MCWGHSPDPIASMTAVHTPMANMSKLFVWDNGALAWLPDDCRPPPPRNEHVREPLHAARIRLQVVILGESVRTRTGRRCRPRRVSPGFPNKCGRVASCAYLPKMPSHLLQAGVRAKMDCMDVFFSESLERVLESAELRGGARQ